MIKKSNTDNSLCSHLRSKKTLQASVINAIAQLIQLATGLLSVPLAINYLGVELFGLWMAISTSLLAISFADFGVGIGMQDKVTRERANNAFEKAAKYFWNAFGFSVFLMFFVILLVNIFAGYFPVLSKVDLKVDVLSLVKVIAIVTALGLVSGVVQRLFSALQEGFLLGIINIVARVLTLLGLYGVVYFDLGFLALVAVVGGVANFVVLFFGLPLILNKNKWLLQSKGMMGLYDYHGFSALIKIGLWGLGATVSIFFVNNALPILIAAKIDLVAVARFSVLNRLLNIPLMFFVYMLLPLWPAITEAVIKKDFNWLVKAVVKCRRLLLVYALVVVVSFLLFARPVIEIWSGKEEMVPGFGLLVIGLFFSIVGLYNSYLSVVLNGFSKYKSQAIYGSIISISSIFLAYFWPWDVSVELLFFIIAFGFLLRCMVMRYEMVSLLKNNTQKL